MADFGIYPAYFEYALLILGRSKRVFCSDLFVFFVGVLAFCDPPGKVPVGLRNIPGYVFVLINQDITVL